MESVTPALWKSFNGFSIRRVNQDAGLSMKSFMSLVFTEQAAAVSAWEKDSFVSFQTFFEILWRLRRSSPLEQNSKAAAAWQVPSPGSVWRDAARPENDVRYPYPSGGYVMITLLGSVGEMFGNDDISSLIPRRPEGSFLEVTLQYSNLLAKAVIKYAPAGVR